MKIHAWPLIGGLSTALLLASSTFAHHGWNWASDDQTELSGTILEVYIGPPHPRLRIQTADDGEWTVDLGNPRQTQEAGFVEGEAAVGDAVTIRGHRSNDGDEKLIKAVRATIDERQYDFYPDRIRES